VLHALHLGPLDTLRGLLGDGSAQITQGLEAEAREALAGQLADPAHHQGVAASQQVRCGSPTDVITANADAVDADLLVVGARGEAFLRHALLGSTASRLLRKSTARPVLMVKLAPAALPPRARACGFFTRIGRGPASGPPAHAWRPPHPDARLPRAL
jgi:CPA2 family monovalent cation:H+ antiporter-2